MIPWAELLPRETRNPSLLFSSPLLSIRKYTLYSFLTLYRYVVGREKAQKRQESIVVPHIRENARKLFHAYDDPLE